MINAKYVVVHYNYISTKRLILFIGFKKSNILIFPIVKMAANYAEIGRVCKLETDFQQVQRVQMFWNFDCIVMKHQSFKISKEI